MHEYGIHLLHGQAESLEKNLHWLTKKQNRGPDSAIFLATNHLPLLHLTKYMAEEKRHKVTESMQ